MWLWLKTKFAAMMMALGVDWPNMSDGDKLQVAVGTFVGAVGIVVAGVALYVAYLSYQVSKKQGGIAETSYEISKRQADIAEKQDEYFEEQAARKEKLELRLFTFSDDENKLVIAVTNRGNRTARDFYWQFLRVVSDGSRVEAHEAPLRKEEVISPDFLNRYTMSSGYVTTPLYPGRSVICAILHVYPPHREAWLSEDRTGLYPYLWAVTSEAGRFPPKGWTELPLEPENVAHEEYKVELFQ